MGYEDIRKHIERISKDIKCETSFENGINDDIVSQLCELQTDLANGGTDDAIFDIYDSVNLAVEPLNNEQMLSLGATSSDIAEMAKLDDIVKNGINITGIFDEPEPDRINFETNVPSTSTVDTDEVITDSERIDDEVDDIDSSEQGYIDDETEDNGTEYIDDSIDEDEETETEDNDTEYIDDAIEEDEENGDNDTEYIDDNIDEDEETGESIVNNESEYIDDNIDEDTEDTIIAEQDYIDDAIDEDEENGELVIDNESEYIDDDIDETDEENDGEELELSDTEYIDDGDEEIDDSVENDTVNEHIEQPSDKSGMSRYRERYRDRRYAERHSRHHNGERPDFDDDDIRNRESIYGRRSGGTGFDRAMDRYNRHHREDKVSNGVNDANSSSNLFKNDENEQPNNIINSDNKSTDEKLADLLLRISNGIMASPQSIKKTLSKLKVEDNGCEDT